MNRNIQIIILLIYIVSSCGNPELESSRIIQTSENKDDVSKLASMEVCDFDSIVVEEGTSHAGKLSKTGRIKILSVGAIKIIQPYLKDSILRKYACCPDTIIGELKVFSNGKNCKNYTVVPSGGLVEWDRDSVNVTLVPDGYQFRVKIPNEKWNIIMKKSRRIKRNPISN